MTGTVAVANGGTGANTLTANSLLVGNGIGAVNLIAPGTSGNVLVSNGTSWSSGNATGSFIQNQSSSTQTASFRISGNGLVAGNIGVGNILPNATLDIRTNPTSTTDPGSGYLGIGTTTTAANTAGAGAVRYNTNSGGVLEYSNGSNWNTLSSNVTKSVVVAKKTTAGSYE